MKKNNFIYILSNTGLLFAAVIWGFAFIVVKNSLNVIPAIYLLAFRFSIASAALAIIFIKKLKYINKQLILKGAILGFFLFIAYVFQTIGCFYTSAGKNAFLTTVYVLIVPFLHWFVNKKKIDMYSFIAAVLGLIGIGLLSLNDNLNINIGDILTLVSGIFFALHLVFISRYTKTEDPILLTLIQLFFAAVFSWILAPFAHGGFPQEFSQEAVISILYLGLLSTMLCFLLQNVCQKYTHPSTASLLLSTEAIFGIFFSVLILKEVINTKMIIGCFLMFIAIIIAETKFDFLKRKI